MSLARTVAPSGDGGMAFFSCEIAQACHFLTAWYAFRAKRWAKARKPSQRNNSGELGLHSSTFMKHCDVQPTHAFDRNGCGRESPLLPPTKPRTISRNTVKIQTVSILIATTLAAEFGSAVAAEELVKFPLTLAWVSRQLQPPIPAFRDSVVTKREGKIPALADRRKLGIYHRQGLAEPASYDYAPQPVVAGNRVYVASSADEAVLCLDTATGKRVWTARAEGPVRFAPLVAGQDVFFGADDGVVYCVDAATGTPRWRRRIAPRMAFALNNARLISAWPVRGGLALANGKLFCAAGVFPEQGVYLAALDAGTGAPVWVKEVPHAIHGNLLVDGDTLWTPTHRTAPCQYDLATSQPRVENLPTLLGRGAAQLWRLDQLVAWGPDEGELIYLQLSPDTKSPRTKMRRGIASPLGVVSPLHGWAAVAGPTHFALLQDDRVVVVELAKFRQAVANRLAAVNASHEPPAELAAYGKLMGSIAAPDKNLMERLETSAAWIGYIPGEESHRVALMAGNVLILGGLKTVRAFDLRTGAPQWSGAVDGQVWKLAVADDALYVGTDAGAVYCFRSGVRAGQEIAPPRAPVDPAFNDIATAAIARAGRDKGICVVAGGGTGKLAAAIAQRSKFNVVILEPDAARAATQRQYLEATGLYGRVVVRHETGAQLDRYPFGMANLIVSEDATAPYPADKLLFLLQPDGGAIVLKSPHETARRGTELSAWEPVAGEWRAAKRGVLPGGGQWPTANGSPGNSMSTGEANVPAAGAALRLQWFGEPFASEIIDRHAVPMAPLFYNGIGVILGEHDTVIAQDAYNGTILWRRKVDGIGRVLASHNSSPVTFSADGRWVFAIAGAECLQLDVVTGEQKEALPGVLPGTTWGYIGPSDGLLIGTSQGKQDFSSTESRQVSALKDWALSAPAASRDLFAVDLTTGRKLWTFAEGVILNPSIAIEKGRIFFAQSRNAAARAATAGNMKMGDWIAKDATGGAEIVALDAATGEVLWRSPITRALDADSHWIMYLTAVDDVVLATRTMFREARRGYDFELLDTATGTSRWTRWLPGKSTTKHAGLGYGKNALSARPIIMGDRFYLRASLDERGTVGLVYGFNLHTGEPVLEGVDTGTQDAGCSVAAGSLNALYFRDYQHSVFDVTMGEQYRLTGATRPSCWPNTFAVGGLVYAPEGGAGCSCGLSYQVSFALVPTPDAPPVKPTPHKRK